MYKAVSAYKEGFIDYTAFDSANLIHLTKERIIFDNMFTTPQQALQETEDDKIAKAAEMMHRKLAEAERNK